MSTNSRLSFTVNVTLNLPIDSGCMYIFPKAVERLAGISLHEPLFIDITADQILTGNDSRVQTEPVQVSKCGCKIYVIYLFYLFNHFHHDYNTKKD